MSSNLADQMFCLYYHDKIYCFSILRFRVFRPVVDVMLNWAVACSRQYHSKRMITNLNSSKADTFLLFFCIGSDKNRSIDREDNRISPSAQALLIFNG